MMNANLFGITLDIVPLAITAGAILVVLALIQLYLGLRAQRRPKVTGEKAMIGETGIIRKTSGFRKRSIVEIRGELWWCVVHPKGDDRLEKGTTVEIVGIEDDSMILEVKRIQVQ
ncbi:MAG: NfeD family protein [Candidatus Fermentibacteraceae bacterium]|nr:NfeD family protein [Candidatus Fermentibacteraceae bacterium]